MATEDNEALGWHWIEEAGETFTPGGGTHELPERQTDSPARL